MDNLTNIPEAFPFFIHALHIYWRSVSPKFLELCITLLRRAQTKNIWRVESAKCHTKRSESFVRQTVLQVKISNFGEIN